MDAGRAAGWRGDPGRLRQVLLNLAGNAVKFTPQARSAPGDRRAAGRRDHLPALRVRDTGIGIPPGSRALFDAFTQVDASTTRQFGGTGLGLAISKHLVELMGGSIGVESRDGGAAPSGLRRVFAVLTAEPAPRRASVQGRRVLRVDDNATNRWVIRTLLGPWECGCAEGAEGP